jgi:hypothetical protein
LVFNLKAQQAAATSTDPNAALDPSISATINGEIAANQQLKERVGGNLNAAISAYKAVHPN